MVQAFLSLTKSRKFWMTVINSALVTGMNYAGVDHAVLAAIAGLFGVNIAGIAFEGPRKPE